MAPRRLTTLSGLSSEPIPTYRIDLSLPPSERYKCVASDFALRMRGITPLFDDVLASVIPWELPRRFVHQVARMALRRVHSWEETQELRGIAKASGVDMHILVALNVLLDSLLGCTSGGVLTLPQRSGEAAGMRQGRDLADQSARMMHFRTLDWGMDELRHILVVLEFVRSESDEPEKVIGTTISYAGYTGVLTGVRNNCSMSLNFRPNHNCSTAALRMHQALVLFGIRPSIASILRNAFISPECRSMELDDVAQSIAQRPAAPCYVILTSRTKSIVVQKDLLDGQICSATDFIVHTNHDLPSTGGLNGVVTQKEEGTILGMETLLEESEERKECVQKKWASLVRRHERKAELGLEDGVIAVREKTLQGWVKAYPIMNECSHFGCIMDPGTGSIRWLERGDT